MDACHILRGVWCMVYACFAIHVVCCNATAMQARSDGHDDAHAVQTIVGVAYPVIVVELCNYLQRVRWFIQHPQQQLQPISLLESREVPATESCTMVTTAAPAGRMD